MTFYSKRTLCSVFNHLLDDNPLPPNEASSSVLVATYFNTPLQMGKGAIGGGKLATNGEVEKGLLTLISSDAPGLQVYFHHTITILITWLFCLCGFLNFFDHSI